MHTLEKIARRIITVGEVRDLDIKAATTRAAWEALEEGRALGWSQPALEGLVATFAAVGVELAVAAGAR